MTGACVLDSDYSGRCCPTTRGDPSVITQGVHSGDKLSLVDIERTSCFKYRLVECIYKEKPKITFSVVFDLFHNVMKPWPTVFVWTQTECQCSTLAFLVSFGILVWVISVRNHTMGFLSVE